MLAFGILFDRVSAYDVRLAKGVIKVYLPVGPFVMHIKIVTKNTVIP